MSDPESSDHDVDSEEQEGITSYEQQRLDNIARIQAKMAELGVPEAVQACAPATKKMPKQPRKQAERVTLAPENLRKSSRARKEVDYTDPGFKYAEARSPKRIKRSQPRTGTSTSWDGEYLSFAARQAATDAAEAAAEQLEDCVVKVMSASHVSGGFWLQVPSELCIHFEHVKHDITLLCDAHPPDAQHNQEDGIWLVGWLPKTDKAGKLTGGVGLSKNWRGFALDQALTPNDTIIMEAVKQESASTTKTLKVHIYRGLDFASSTERDSLPASAQDTERHEAPDGDAVDASEQSDEGSSLHEDDDVPIAQVRKALEQQRRAPKTESRSQAPASRVATGHVHRGKSGKAKLPGPAKLPLRERGNQQSNKLPAAPKAEMRQEESDGVSCHVQKILAVRQDEKGDLEFQIRWWGFGPEDDTWEPQGNLDRPLTYKWQSKSQKARCKAFMSAA